MPFGASLVENGQQRSVAPGPRIKIPLLQLFSLAVRYPMNERCDAGYQLYIGATGGDVRCGIGDAHKTIAVSSGATFKWWHGIVGRTEIQAGAQRDGLVVFATSGVTYGFFKHAIASDYPPNTGTPLEDLLIGPQEPFVRVSQTEVAWSSSLTFGFPDLRGHGTYFASVSVDRPFWTTDPRYECRGCTTPRTFSGFDPGIRVGGMIGFGGTTP
jgi:hypothetical protein